MVHPQNAQFKLQNEQGWTDEVFYFVDWDNFKISITAVFKASKNDFSQYI